MSPSRQRSVEEGEYSHSTAVRPSTTAAPSPKVAPSISPGVSSRGSKRIDNAAASVSAQDRSPPLTHDTCAIIEFRIFNSETTVRPRGLALSSAVNRSTSSVTNEFPSPSLRGVGESALDTLYSPSTTAGDGSGRYIFHPSGGWICCASACETWQGKDMDTSGPSAAGVSRSAAHRGVHREDTSIIDPNMLSSDTPKGYGPSVGSGQVSTPGKTRPSLQHRSDAFVSIHRSLSTTCPILQDLALLGAAEGDATYPVVYGRRLADFSDVQLRYGLSHVGIAIQGQHISRCEMLQIMAALENCVLYQGMELKVLRYPLRIKTLLFHQASNTMVEENAKQEEVGSGSSVGSGRSDSPSLKLSLPKESGKAVLPSLVYVASGIVTPHTLINFTSLSPVHYVVLELSREMWSPTGDGGCGLDWALKRFLPDFLVERLPLARACPLIRLVYTGRLVPFRTPFWEEEMALHEADEEMMGDEDLDELRSSRASRRRRLGEVLDVLYVEDFVPGCTKEHDHCNVAVQVEMSVEAFLRRIQAGLERELIQLHGLHRQQGACRPQCPPSTDSVVVEMPNRREEKKKEEGGGGDVPLGGHEAAEIDPDAFLSPEYFHTFVSSRFADGSAFTFSQASNTVECLAVVLDWCDKEHQDTRFQCTGHAITVVSAGKGLYDVTNAVVQVVCSGLHDIGIETVNVVSLGRPPLHTTPLFVYSTDDWTLITQSHLNTDGRLTPTSTPDPTLENDESTSGTFLPRNQSSSYCETSFTKSSVRPTERLYYECPPWMSVFFYYPSNALNGSDERFDLLTAEEWYKQHRGEEGTEGTAVGLRGSAAAAGEDEPQRVSAAVLGGSVDFTHSLRRKGATRRHAQWERPSPRTSRRECVKMLPDLGIPVLPLPPVLLPRSPVRCGRRDSHSRLSDAQFQRVWQQCSRRHDGRGFVSYISFDLRPPVRGPNYSEPIPRSYFGREAGGSGTHEVPPLFRTPPPCSHRSLTAKDRDPFTFPWNPNGFYRLYSPKYAVLCEKRPKEAEKKPANSPTVDTASGAAVATAVISSIASNVPRMVSEENKTFPTKMYQPSLTRRVPTEKKQRSLVDSEWFMLDRAGLREGGCSAACSPFSTPHHGPPRAISCGKHVLDSDISGGQVQLQLRIIRTGWRWNELVIQSDRLWGILMDSFKGRDGQLALLYRRYEEIPEQREALNRIRIKQQRTNRMGEGQSAWSDSYSPTICDHEGGNWTSFSCPHCLPSLQNSACFSPSSDSDPGQTPYVPSFNAAAVFLRSESRCTDNVLYLSTQRNSCRFFEREEVVFQLDRALVVPVRGPPKAKAERFTSLYGFEYSSAPVRLPSEEPMLRELGAAGPSTFRDQEKWKEEVVGTVVLSHRALFGITPIHPITGDVDKDGYRPEAILSHKFDVSTTRVTLRSRWLYQYPEVLDWEVPLARRLAAMSVTSKHLSSGPLSRRMECGEGVIPSPESVAEELESVAGGEGFHFRCNYTGGGTLREQWIAQEAEVPLCCLLRQRLHYYFDEPFQCFSPHASTAWYRLTRARMLPIYGPPTTFPRQCFTVIPPHQYNLMGSEGEKQTEERRLRLTEYVLARLRVGYQIVWCDGPAVGELGVGSGAHALSAGGASQAGMNTASSGLAPHGYARGAPPPSSFDPEPNAGVVLTIGHQEHSLKVLETGQSVSVTRALHYGRYRTTQMSEFPVLRYRFLIWNFLYPREEFQEKCLEMHPLVDVTESMYWEDLDYWFQQRTNAFLHLLPFAPSSFLAYHTGLLVLPRLGGPHGQSFLRLYSQQQQRESSALASSVGGDSSTTITLHNVTPAGLKESGSGIFKTTKRYKSFTGTPFPTEDTLSSVPSDSGLCSSPSTADAPEASPQDILWAALNQTLEKVRISFLERYGCKKEEGEASAGKGLSAGQSRVQVLFYPKPKDGVGTHTLPLWPHSNEASDSFASPSFHKTIQERRGSSVTPPSIDILLPCSDSHSWLLSTPKRGPLSTPKEATIRLSTPALGCFVVHLSWLSCTHYLVNALLREFSVMTHDSCFRVVGFPSVYQARTGGRGKQSSEPSPLAPLQEAEDSEGGAGQDHLCYGGPAAPPLHESTPHQDWSVPKECISPFVTYFYAVGLPATTSLDALIAFRERLIQAVTKMPLEAWMRSTGSTNGQTPLFRQGKQAVSAVAVAAAMDSRVSSGPVEAREPSVGLPAHFTAVSSGPLDTPSLLYFPDVEKPLVLGDSEPPVREDTPCSDNGLVMTLAGFSAREGGQKELEPNQRFLVHCSGAAYLFVHGLLQLRREVKARLLMVGRASGTPWEFYQGSTAPWPQTFPPIPDIIVAEWRPNVAMGLGTVEQRGLLDALKHAEGQIVAEMREEGILC